jgi:hypothetical protein
MQEGKGKRLIRELLDDPVSFTEEGRAYALLEAYFDGFELNTLSALLRHDNLLVQRAAVFVAAELGLTVCEILDDVLPLASSGDRRVAYHAIEVLAVCCRDGAATGFAEVVRLLGSEDEIIRGLAMRVVAGADVSQLDAARLALLGSPATEGRHTKGLALLLRAVDPAVILEHIRGDDPLLRRYAAIAAWRRSRDAPSLIAEVAISEDAELQAFWRAIDL